MEAAGVDVVFGIPGVHTLALYDALANHRPDVARAIATAHIAGVEAWLRRLWPRKLWPRRLWPRSLFRRSLLIVILPPVEVRTK